MNPLDVSEAVKPIQDVPGGYPLAAQGIPGIISGDAVTQNFVSVLCAEVQKANDFAWGDYQGLLTQWKSDNAKGIFRPAPGPVTLATVDQRAAAAWLQTGTHGAGIIGYIQQFDPEFPPGTVESAPAPPPSPAKTAESVGGLIPGTFDLYSALGGPYDPGEVGKTLETPNGHFALINSTPMGFRPMWKKLS